VKNWSTWIESNHRQDIKICFINQDAPKSGQFRRLAWSLAERPFSTGVSLAKMLKPIKMKEKNLKVCSGSMGSDWMCREIWVKC
jgi:hypothetical protein